MRLDTARRFALSLPETTEEPHFEKSSFRVHGKIFATVPLGGKHLHVFVDPEEVHALIGEDPDAFEAVTSGRRVVPGAVRVILASADRRQVSELLEEAWRHRAPKRVLAAYEARRAF